MRHAPIVVHPTRPAGGRQVTLRIEERDVVLGVALTDADVVELLRRAGVDNADEAVFGDTGLVEWHVDDPHSYEAEPSDTDIP